MSQSKAREPVAGKGESPGLACREEPIPGDEGKEEEAALATLPGPAGKQIQGALFLLGHDQVAQATRGW